MEQENKEISVSFFRAYPMLARLGARAFRCRPRGFTMIELLISIGIFVMITGIVVTSFSHGKYRDELVAAGAALQSAVREAQTFTTAGTTIRCPQLAPTDPAAPPVGYGVYINQVFGQPSVVVLYADCRTDSTPYTYDTDAHDDAVVRQVTLPANVALRNFLPATAPPLNIVFSPLIETVAVNGTPAYQGEATLELIHGKSGHYLTMRVNAFTGQVFMSQPQ